MYTLDSISTTDAYPDGITGGGGGAILDGLPHIKKFTLTVLNNAVKVQEKLAQGGVAVRGEGWGPEYTLPPTTGSYLRHGLTGIRFRSAAAGVPAVVTVAAYAEGE